MQGLGFRVLQNWFRVLGSGLRVLVSSLLRSSGICG